MKILKHVKTAKANKKVRVSMTKSSASNDVLRHDDADATNTDSTADLTTASPAESRPSDDAGDDNSDVDSAAPFNSRTQSYVRSTCSQNERVVAGTGGGEWKGYVHGFDVDFEVRKDECNSGVQLRLPRGQVGRANSRTPADHPVDEPCSKP